MRKILVTLVIIFIASSSTSARQLTPEEALRRISDSALTSRAAGGQTIDAATSRLAYSAPGGEYYVFNLKEGGHVVAAGDDCAEAVLAEIPDGNFMADRIPPAAKWLLDEYSAQIKSARSGQAQNTSSTGSSQNDIAYLYGKWEPIAPLMTCRWNQTNPYNRMCPVKNGAMCVTGCVATAMAQVIRTIGYAKGNGYKCNTAGDAPVEFTYTDCDFNLNDLPDVAAYSIATNEQIDAVAKLMLACGLSVNMGYSPSSSGAQSSAVPSALKEYFGYSDYTTMYNRRNFSTAQWESIVYTELQLNRPVYYSGNDGSIGHAFVIDGYRGKGLWHVNWGWGGVSNGYYRLWALTPGEQGAGGSSSGYGYNNAQSLVKAVPPGAEPGIVVGDIVGSFALVRDGIYSVYFKTVDKAVSNLTLGVVITDAEGTKLNQVVFWRGQNVSSSGALRMDEYACDFSECNLSAGTYRIYPAVGRNGSDDLQIVEKCEGRNHYVELAVGDDGVYSYSNLPETALPAEDIHIAEVSEKELSEFNPDVHFILVNNGSADFNSSITIGLVPEGETEYVCSSAVSDVSIPAGYNSVFAKKIILWDANYNDLPAGAYKFVFKDADGNVIDPDKSFDVTVNDFSRLSWNHPSHFYVFNAEEAPDMIYCGDKWDLSVGIYNDEERDTKIDLQFFVPGTTTRVKSYQVFKGTLAVMDTRMQVETPEIDLPFGIYDVAYVEGKSEISDRAKVKISESVDGLYFIPLSDSEVAVAPHPGNAYAGDVVVPAQVSINGKNYSVTSIAPDAFSCSGKLSSVDVAPSVTAIGANAFSSCPDVSHIILRNAEVPFAYRNQVAAGLSGSADFYIPAEGYDKCNEILGTHHAVFALIQSMESREIVSGIGQTQTEIAISPVHVATNPGYTAFPVTSTIDPAAEVSVIDAVPGKVSLNIIAHHQGVSEFDICSEQPGLSPARVKVEVVSPTAIEEVGTDDETLGIIHYDLEGRRVSPSSLRRGQIIVTVTPNGAKKHIVTDMK